MADINKNKFVRFSQFDIAQCSQFKEFNYEQEKTPIQQRLYFLMLNGAQPRGVNESLYGWCIRIGLSKSTAFGIFTKGNQNMHLSVAQTIADATGADIDWIRNGTGTPFPIDSYDEIIERQIEEAFSTETKVLDTSLLQQAFETLDQALSATNKVMAPEGRSKFVATVYASLKEQESLNTEVLEDCIYTIEEALKSTRRVMSPKAKTDLILVIYDLYSGEASYKEAMKSTINQLIRSVS